MTFALYAFRFEFRVLERVHFTAGKTGNHLRGAFGNVLRRIACDPACPGAKLCERRSVCTYARLFEPACADGPSGFAESPRPLVFRAGNLEGRTLAVGEHFYFDLHIFDLARPLLAHLVLAFKELALEGIGPGRGRVQLRLITSLDSNGRPALKLFEGATVLGRSAPEPIRLALDPDSSAPSTILVEFLTPTELKAGNRVVPEPVFSVLFARVRDRISSLRSFYGEGPLSLDFKSLTERAASVRMLRNHIEWENLERRSSRTGETHPLGGFIGKAEYSGDFRDSLPFLRAAEWTGVGRHTVWGNGAIRVSALSES